MSCFFLFVSSLVYQFLMLHSVKEGNKPRQRCPFLFKLEYIGGIGFAFTNNVNYICGLHIVDLLYQQRGFSWRMKDNGRTSFDLQSITIEVAEKNISCSPEVVISLSSFASLLAFYIFYNCTQSHSLQMQLQFHRLDDR